MTTPVTVDNFRLTAALAYAARGWRVFPLCWPKIGPTGAAKCSCGKDDCGSKAKHPLTEHGRNDGTTDEALIRRWWGRWPAANVGIATGAESGVIVLDVDPKHGGNETLAALTDEHGQLPETVEVSTGGGGLHLFFRHPGRRVPNTNSDKGHGIGRGLDVRGDGGYVAAVPSLHASGRRYEWCAGAAPEYAELADPPEWLLKLLEEPKPSTPAAVSGESVGKKWLGRALAKADDGSRNDTGLWLACQLRDAGLSLAESELLMREYAERSPRGEFPYTVTEAVKTLQSAYARPARDSAALKVPGKAPALIVTQPADAAAELGVYLEGVIAGKIYDARLPWPLLTKLSCSMLPGSVTVVCGDPGVGKTFWTLECLRFWHGNGDDCAVYFIEKDRRFHTMRLLAQLEEDSRFVDYEWLRDNGQAVRDALDRNREYIAELGKFIYSSAGGRVTLDGLIGWVRQMASAGKRVLVVDPITAVDAGSERWVKDDEFVIEAQKICNAHGASLLLVTHPRRGNRQGGATVHDVAGGSAYARFVDTILWINRPKKPRRVRVRRTSSPSSPVMTDRFKLFVQLQKTRDGRGAGMELAYTFGGELCFAEQGIVIGEVREEGGEAA